MSALHTRELRSFCERQNGEMVGEVMGPKVPELNKQINMHAVKCA